MCDEKLVTDNMRLVYHVYERLDKSDFVIRNKQDMVSEGFLGLIKAAESYDAEKNIKFSTYASRCIMNQMLMYIRKNKKHEQREISLFAPISRDGDGNELTYSDVIPDESAELDLYIETTHFNVKFGRFYSRLSGQNRLILALRYSGLKQRQIAAKLGFSQSYVARLLRNMKAEYKKAA